MRGFARCFARGFVKKCDMFCKRFCGQFLEVFCKGSGGFIIQTPSFYCEKHNRNNTPFSQKYRTNLRMLSFLKYFI